MIFTNPNFLCCYQSFANQPYSFHYTANIAAIIATNYSNLLNQCFTNHNQSDPVLYSISLPVITNKFSIHNNQS